MANDTIITKLHVLLETLGIDRKPSDILLWDYEGIVRSHKFFVDFDHINSRDLADFGFFLVDHNCFQMPFDNVTIELAAPGERRFFHIRQMLGFGYQPLYTRTVDQYTGAEAASPTRLEHVKRDPEDVQLRVMEFGIKDGSRQVKIPPTECFINMSDRKTGPFDFNHVLGVRMEAYEKFDGQAYSETVMQIICAFVALIESKSSRKTAVKAPQKLNSARIKRGKPPIFEYHIIDVPNQIQNAQEGKNGHASPKLHWRRGHLRHLGNGKIIRVAPCLVGCAENGVIAHLYKSRAVRPNLVLIDGGLNDGDKS